MKKFILLALTAQTVLMAGCATTPTRTVYSSGPAYSQPVYTQSQPVYTQSQPVYTQSQPVYTQAAPQEDYNKKVIKQGILGAATGAIAAEASGGKAGQGALIGAGTNIIGGALLDYLTAPQAQAQQTQYAPYVNQWNQQNPSNNRVVRKYDANGNVVSEEVYTR